MRKINCPNMAMWRRQNSSAVLLTKQILIVFLLCMMAPAISSSVSAIHIAVRLPLISRGLCDDTNCIFISSYLLLKRTTVWWSDMHTISSYLCGC